MTPPQLRIGTRGSRLALMQTELVRRALAGAHPELAAPGALEVVTIRTTGDRVTDRPLAELGGKGLFCKEIEAALLARRIDLAVHSIKDLPTWLPDGLILGAVLEREDPRDVLIARPRATIAELPEAPCSARHRCGARRSCWRGAPTCGWSISAATSTAGCASLRPARSMRRCWRSPACAAWASRMRAWSC